MKKEGINKLLSLFLLILIGGVSGYLGIQAFNEAVKDNNEFYENKISNLESEIKLLKDLNKIYKEYKTDSIYLGKNTTNHGDIIGFTIDGKSLKLEEVIDYSNNLLNERNMYKSILEIIEEKYGIRYYENADEIFIEEIPNGKIKSLEKENNILKQNIKFLEKKIETKIVNKNHDSITNR